MAPVRKPKSVGSPPTPTTTSSVVSSASGKKGKTSSSCATTTATEEMAAPLPVGADALKMECGKLIEENTVLKRCLRLMRDNSCLETASLLSAIVAFCDGKFRRRFADGMDGIPMMPLEEKPSKTRGSASTQTSKQQEEARKASRVSIAQDPSPRRPSKSSLGQRSSKSEAGRPEGEEPPQAEGGEGAREGGEEGGEGAEKVEGEEAREGEEGREVREGEEGAEPAEGEGGERPEGEEGGEGGGEEGEGGEGGEEEVEEEAAEGDRYEQPERDVPCPQARMSIQEVPVRDVSPGRGRGGSRAGGRVCGECHHGPRSKSPPVSIGGRMMKEDIDPYLYASSPDSKHMQSHMQTRTPVMSDLEYDALYLRSLALAAGYRALAKGLDPRHIPPSNEYQYVGMDQLCKTVANIPPNRMFMKMGKKYPKERVVIHTCVAHKPTECEPFTREGKRQGDCRDPFTKKMRENPDFWTRPVYETYMRNLGSPLGVDQQAKDSRRTKRGSRSGKGRRCSHKHNKSADRRMDDSEFSEARMRGQFMDACPTCGRSDSESPSRSPCKGASPECRNAGTGSPREKKSSKAKGADPKVEPEDYDFHAVVEPIINQARQNISQITSTDKTKKPGDDTTSFHLTHLHKEYKYKEDGSAIVQQDMYKKSYNWESSDEEGSTKGGKKAVQNVSKQQMREVSASRQSIAGNVQDILSRVKSDTTTSTGGQYTDTSSVPDGEEKEMPKEEEGNNSHNHPEHVRWDPKTQFQTHDSQHLIELTKDVHPRKLSHPGLQDLKPHGHGHDDPNKTNNYPISRSDSEATSSKSEQWVPVSPTTREVDWANHCEQTSPFRVVVPKVIRPKPSQPVVTKSLVPQIPDMLLPGQTFDSPVDGKDISNKKQSRALELPSKLSAWDPVTGYNPLVPAGPSHTDIKMIAADLTGKNLLGEVAFQLERRVLDYVFAKSLPDWALDNSDAARRRRFYGYTVNNIGEMINREALAGEHYSRGTERMLRERLRTVLDILTPMGYDLLEHGSFSQDVINKYGLLAKQPCGRDLNPEVGLPGLEVADVQSFIAENTETEHERHNLLLVFDCLRMLAIEDGRPLFVW